MKSQSYTAGAVLAYANGTRHCARLIEWERNVGESFKLDIEASIQSSDFKL